MAVRRAVESGTLTNSASAIYTCPANKKATIVKLTLYNYTSGGVAVTVHLAEDGAAAGDGNEIWKNAGVSLAADTETAPNLAGHTLPPGGKIYGTAGANTSINYYLTMAEEDA